MDEKVLTPNILIKGIIAVLLKEEVEKMDETPITGRLQNLIQSKKKLNKRWINECLDNLKEPPYDKTKIPSRSCES